MLRTMYSTQQHHIDMKSHLQPIAYSDCNHTRNRFIPENLGFSSRRSYNPAAYCGS